MDQSKTQLRAFCAICFREQAVHGDRLVDHGYEIPHAWHQRVGSCSGVRQPHFGTEEGREVARSNGKFIREWAAARRRDANKLRVSPPTQVTVEGKYLPDQREYEKVQVGKGDYRYAQKLEAMISHLEYQARMADGDAKMVEERVASWKPQQPREVQVESGPTVHFFTKRSPAKVLCVWTRSFGSSTVRHSTENRGEVNCTRCLKMLAAQDAAASLRKEAEDLVEKMVAKHGAEVRTRFSPAADAAVKEIRYRSKSIDKKVRAQACEIIERGVR